VRRPFESFQPRPDEIGRHRPVTGLFAERAQDRRY
jgi:hypothetical protein